MRIRTPLVIVVLMAMSLATSQAQVHGQAATAPSPAKAPFVAGQTLGVASVPNLRDVGGYLTRDGLIVRTQVLYRSNQLTRVSPDDLKKLEQLGLHCVYDLRREPERTSAPDRLPAGVKDIWLNVMADSPRTARAARSDDNDGAKSDEDEVDPYLETYRKLVSLPSAQIAFNRLFTELQNEANLPALFHCAAGKDRAGWATAALLSLLGVPRDVVFKDYLLSNEYLSPSLRVKREHLQSAFDEVEAKYGTIENYFSQGLKIDAAGQQALKDRFLVKAAQ